MVGGRRKAGNCWRELALRVGERRRGGDTVQFLWAGKWRSGMNKGNGGEGGWVWGLYPFEYSPGDTRDKIGLFMDSDINFESPVPLLGRKTERGVGGRGRQRKWVARMGAALHRSGGGVIASLDRQIGRRGDFTSCTAMEGGGRGGTPGKRGGIRFVGTDI